jgi:gluconokinase
MDRRIIIMGVSGSGKTAMGRAASERLGWLFLDADDLHSAENIAKMRRGEPLTDSDRAPWLAAIAERLSLWRLRKLSGFVACSALRRDYRNRLLLADEGARFVLLSADVATLTQRLERRQEHFMPSSLLASQIAVFERPAPEEPVTTMSAGLSFNETLDAVIQAARN